MERDGEGDQERRRGDRKKREEERFNMKKEKQKVLEEKITTRQGDTDTKIYNGK